MAFSTIVFVALFAQFAFTPSTSQNCGPLQSAYPSMFLRGKFNDWGNLRMKLSTDNVWIARKVNFDDRSPYAGGAFKFDAFGDWRINWGDNDKEGFGDRDGANIEFSCSRGNYTILFNDKTFVYQIIAENPPGRCPKLVSTFRSMYLRGTFNNWGNTRMFLRNDYTWVATRIIFRLQNDGQYKFDAFGDWSTNWGDNDGNGKGDRHGSNIGIGCNRGPYSIVFNDRTLTYLAFLT